MNQETDKVDRQRINMRLPAILLIWARRYSKKKNKTVTQVVVDCLTELKEEDEHAS